MSLSIQRMYVLIFILGVILIALEVLASQSNRHVAAALPSSHSRWRFAYRWRFLVGVPLAVASAFISYPLSGGEDQYQVHGFPFMVMAIDQRGWDYVGILSVPFLVLNGLIWLFLPSLVLWCLARGSTRAIKNA
jgi:hypothetical protein